MSTFGGKGKLRSTVHGPYRKEKDTIFSENCEQGILWSTVGKLWSTDHRVYRKEKYYMANNVNHDRPLVNYDHPWSSTLPAGTNQS